MKAAGKAHPMPVANASRGIGRLLERWSSVLLVITLIGVWEAGVRIFDVPRFLLPTPTEIVQLTLDEWSLIQMHSLATIWAIFTG